MPQGHLPVVVISKAAPKKPKPPHQRTLRNYERFKLAVRFKNEFEGLGSKKSTKKT